MEAFTSVRARWLKIASCFKLIARSMKNRSAEEKRSQSSKRFRKVRFNTYVVQNYYSICDEYKFLARCYQNSVPSGG